MIEGLEKGKEIALTALPLYHIFAFTVNLLGFWALGRAQPPDPQSAPAFEPQARVRELPITWMSGVNTLFNGLSNEIWFLDTPPKHLKFASAGGMALADRRGRAVGGDHRQAAPAGLRPDGNLAGADLQPAGQDARGLHRRAGALDRCRLSRRGGKPVPQGERRRDRRARARRS
jgi:long-chain acyl-CoA synthetase